MTILAGAQQTDTIGATLPETLVVRLTGFAKASGHGVAFFDNYNLTIRPAGRDTTDDQGIVKYIVTFGVNAGDIVTTASTLRDGNSDELIKVTWIFVVEPGHATHLEFGPTRSAVYTDSSVRVAIRYAWDRADNLTKSTAPITLTALSNNVTVNGTTITGMALGVGAIRATVLDTTDTIALSVVPHGVLSGAGNGVITSDLDLENIRTVGPPGAIASTFGNARWTPASDGWLVVGMTVTGSNVLRTGLFVMDTLGNLVTEVDPGDAVSGDFGDPVFSRDGKWVYFDRQTTGFGQCTCTKLFRAPADGSGPSDTLLNAQPGVIDAGPSPSPDGTQVAYVSSAQPNVFHLRILTIATGAVADLGLAGASAYSEVGWSPTSNLIAFDTPDGHLAVINSDGTGLRTLGSALYDLDWSPDGQYIVGYNNGVSVVQVSTGLSIPVAAPGTSWKPSALPSAMRVHGTMRRTTHSR